MTTLKVGMIGLDTSHCEAFTSLLNNKDNQFHVPGAEVVAAVPGGSKTFSSSYNRVEGITATLKEKFNLKMFDSIDEMGQGMDAFLLESVDGAQHLEQFKQLVKFGKPVFIDKPFACNYEDAKAIIKLAEENNVPIMTASAIRYAKGIADLVEEGEKVESCEAFGPMAILDDYRDYFWYGIHSAEVLFSIMGSGCKSVKTVFTDKIDVITGIWDDGKIGTLRGNRIGANTFGCTTFSEKGTKFALADGSIPYYALLMKQIISFIQTGKSPIPIQESLEIIGFLEAASQSRANGGKEVEL